MLINLTNGVVCHMKERPGFSTEKYFFKSKHNWIKSQVMPYNLFAAATRMAKVPDRLGSPSSAPRAPVFALFLCFALLCGWFLPEFVCLI